MPRAGLFIGFSATAAFAYLAHRSLAKVGRVFDEAWGDWPHLPEYFGDAARAGSGADATEGYDVRTRHAAGLTP